jgi:predicted nucleotidyltransferase component of viral defense system
MGQQRLSKDIDATRTAPPMHQLDSRHVASSIQQSAREVATDSGSSLDFDSIRFEGPCGTRGDIAVEVSYREAVVLDPLLPSIGSPFYEPFAIPVMQPAEMVAEKLRTLAQRHRPTDLSDLAFLIESPDQIIEPDSVRQLVPVKFQLVRDGNHLARIRDNITNMAADYESAVRSVAPDAPDYEHAARVVLRSLKRWFD